MRFCVVGPTYPFRGGIAQHTTLLCRRLSERHEVDAVTFKRLYPSILFPGKSQIDQSESSTSFTAERIVDSMNPFSWIQAAKSVRDKRPDWVIVPWWNAFFGPCMASILGRVSPSKVMFVCHNVLPHESSSIAKPLTLHALRHGDAFIVHSGDQKAALEETFPGRRVEKTILPEFDVFPRQGMDKAHARARLGIEGRTILFFGLVRKYKGLIDLIHAMHLLGDEKITLIVAGEFYEDKRQYLAEIDRLQLGNRVRIVDSYIPNEDVESYFAASDVVVLPYKSATQSAVVQVAWRFERPVIATMVGGLPEAVDDGRTGLLAPPDDPSALARSIRRFYNEELGAGFTTAIQADRGRFSWDRVIETVELLGGSV